MCENIIVSVTFNYSVFLLFVASLDLAYVASLPCHFLDHEMNVNVSSAFFLAKQMGLVKTRWKKHL